MTPDTATTAARGRRPVRRDIAADAATISTLPGRCAATADLARDSYAGPPPPPRRCEYCMEFAASVAVEVGAERTYACLSCLVNLAHHTLALARDGGGS